MTLIEMVHQDLVAFLANPPKLMFNERDFQVHLCVWLKRSAFSYDEVEVEYDIPYQELGKDCPWTNEMRLDIVVQKDGEFLPVELKYKTKRIEKNVFRFGEALDKVEVVKNQGAQDLGMYDFWKDVRRLELVRNRFQRVTGGLAVFVTNDPKYQNVPRSTSNPFAFRMTKDNCSLKRYWQYPEKSSAKDRPNFDLDQAYQIQWEPMGCQGLSFHYCIVAV